MKIKPVRILEILLALVLIVAVFAVVRQSLDYKRGQEDYSEAEQLAKLPAKTLPGAPSRDTVLTNPAAEDPYAEMLKDKIDLSALRDVNADVLGWIEIPGTEVSYPVLQGEDNNYYLNHTWKGETNSVGSVFLECQADPELADFNTIIYGHRMRDLSMFGSLKYYEDLSYWEENPSVYVVIDGEAYRYDIYAAYNADPEDITYGLKITGRSKKQELIQFGLDNSVIETGIIPTTYDRILTLSTCTANDRASRWVVQGVYHIEASDAPKDVKDASEEADDASSNKADSLVFPDTTGSETKQWWSIFNNRLYIIIPAGLCAAAAVAFVIFRRSRKKDT